MNRPNWQQSVSMLLLSSVLSACASFGPDKAPAERMTAAQLTLPDQPAHQPEAGWWQALHDQTLNQLIDQAIGNAPSMRLAADRLREAKNAVGLNQSSLGPQLNLNAIDERQLYSANGLFPPPIGGNYVNSYTLSLNAAWELDFWGKNRARVAAALGQARAAVFERQQAALTLTQAIIAQYTALQRQLQQLQINQARIRLAQSRIQLMRARVQAGLLSADTLHPVEQGLAGLQSQMAMLLADGQRSRHALATLSGQAPTALDQLQPEPLGPTPAVADAKLTAGLLGSRPDIASQREMVESMSEMVKASKAEFYPNISISGLVGVNSLAYSTLFKQASKIVDVQPALTLPIFHSGQLRANLQIAESRYDQAVDQYNQTVLTSLQQAADAMAGDEQARAQLKDAQRAGQASQKTADAMRLRMQAGMANKLDILDSQDNLLQARASQFDAEANARLAWVSLNTAMGGGVIAGSPLSRQEMDQ